MYKNGINNKYVKKNYQPHKSGIGSFIILSAVT